MLGPSLCIPHKHNWSTIGSNVSSPASFIALMARFPVENIEDNRLQLAVKSPFVTGHVNKETGELTDGPNDYYYGCWVGEGEAARPVTGISNTTPAWLYPAGTADGDALDEDYLGKVVSLWHYGVGDSVEVARVKD